MVAHGDVQIHDSSGKKCSVLSEVLEVEGFPLSRLSTKTVDVSFSAKKINKVRYGRVLSP